MARVRGVPSKKAKENLELILGVLDDMPPELRALVHEFDYNPVVTLINKGVEHPDSIRRILSHKQQEPPP